MRKQDMFNGDTDCRNSQLSFRKHKTRPFFKFRVRIKTEGGNIERIIQTLIVSLNCTTKLLHIWFFNSVFHNSFTIIFQFQFRFPKDTFDAFGTRIFLKSKTREVLVFEKC